MLHDLHGPFTAQAALADPANHIVTLQGPRDWTTHEVTAPIPDDANTVAFGLFLAGPAGSSCATQSSPGLGCLISYLNGCAAMAAK